MYAPTQNGIEKSVRSVRYAEAAPPYELRELVYCFWELKTDAALPEDFQYHVLPDACVDIIFDATDPRLATIMTPHTTSEVLVLGRSFHYVGVRLLPGVWRGGLENVVGSSVDVLQIGGLSVASLCAELKERDFSAQQATLSNVVRRLAKNDLAVTDSLVVRILENTDTIRTVADMARLVAMSPRQLQRRLKQAVGFSPHDFLKVLHLQQSFGQHYLASYTDQSHFIHSFRRITGYTPAKYAKKFDV
ncbi:AraC family transcriptional regulator [Candidatus Saccharibacteria bacterium]|nr:MAG: AraC family transcriptional regulator [Candidatus Saccharibacteria bacterium]